MNLYFKQRVFSFGQKADIYNERGEVVYTCESEIFTIGRKTHLYDHMGNEVAFIQQQLFSFTPRFYVSMQGRPVAEIVKEFTFFRQSYRIEGPDWKIEGDFFAHDYEIVDQGRYIATIHKKWMSFGDCFEVSIDSKQNADMVLAVVIAIDCVLDAADSNNSST